MTDLFQANSLSLSEISHQSCSIIKAVLRNFAKFTGKHLYQSLFFNEVAGLRPATLLKMRLWHRCFSVNFAKFLRTNFFTEHLQTTASVYPIETSENLWFSGDVNSEYQFEMSLQNSMNKKNVNYQTYSRITIRTLERR